MTEQQRTGPQSQRIRQAARRSLPRRLAILAGVWTSLPLLAALLVHGIGASGGLL
ncbi:hypothetical protein ABZ023_15365 [Streptomyces sp. NPDC006367]|uniref:hypothetical protein n=1 Tax=unclassified Streptomyces TaxID=2593676 RepID=UPI0033A18D01